MRGQFHSKSTLVTGYFLLIYADRLASISASEVPPGEDLFYYPALLGPLHGGRYKVQRVFLNIGLSIVI